MPTNRLTALQETQLIDGLKAKSSKAFERLYDCYSAALFGVLVKIVKDQDLLQECMIKVWKNIHRHDLTQGRLFTWLLNITRNTAIDFLRSQQKRSFCDFSEVEALLNLEVGPQPSFSYIGFQDQVVASLSPRHWQLINLIYFQGYTHPEVAELLNLPLGTVKTWTRVALQQLRVTFQADQ